MQSLLNLPTNAILTKPPKYEGILCERLSLGRVSINLMGFRQPTNCWNSNGLFSFRPILLPHFYFYSTSLKITSSISTSTRPISCSQEPNSLLPLTNWFVSSLGFSEKQALSTSTKLTRLRQSRGVKQVCNPNLLLTKADLVVNFLQRNGLEKSQIANVVSSAPQILACRIEGNLEPKIKFFQELGLSVSDFADVISTQPAILGTGLDSTIRPAVEQLRDIMGGSNEKVVRVIKGLRLTMFHRVTTTLVHNVSTLRAQGIPIETIQKNMVRNPSCFMRKPEDFKEIMARAETKWGISPHSSVFLSAVKVLSSMNEKTIESKCGVFESFGWDQSNVVDLFRRNPLLFGLSEGNIRDTLSFFMSKLGYDPGYLIAHNSLLNYSLEKRVVPRYQVYQLLKEKGLIRGDQALSSMLTVAESQFLARFVRPFEEDVPHLYQTYINSINSSSQLTSNRGKKHPFPRKQIETCVIAG